MSTDTRAIDVHDLSCGYGSSVVVRGLDLHVDAGEVVALLGANGAGKTTTLLTLAGVLPVIAGEVRLFGTRINRWSAPRIARHGVASIPDDRGLFPKLTVRENLSLATSRRGHVPDALALFPELQTRLRTPAGLLSGGQQQMLAIARALVREPRLLLIDELSFGLAPIAVQRLVPVVREVAERSGAGVLLVEQHVHLGLACADRAYVLSHGSVVLAGTAANLRDDTSLLHESYLGAVDDTKGRTA
ncbi:MAG TPA: ABC transporter ATP-binding protein [Acidimicrobiales bacterium]|nr:ABC transporter ATP-binding protein [Acidimicrobiales bacterium]